MDCAKGKLLKNILVQKILKFKIFTNNYYLHINPVNSNTATQYSLEAHTTALSVGVGKQDVVGRASGKYCRARDVG